MKKSKGSIPMPYIVAAIFAIIIIVIVGYMFFTHTGIFSKTSALAICEAKCLEYCTLHRDEDWEAFDTACSADPAFANCPTKCK